MCGKNNHIFLNREIKNDFFLFYRKKHTVFSHNSFFCCKFVAESLCVDAHNRTRKSPGCVFAHSGTGNNTVHFTK